MNGFIERFNRAFRGKFLRMESETDPSWAIEIRSAVPLKPSTVLLTWKGNRLRKVSSSIMRHNRIFQTVLKGLAMLSALLVACTMGVISILILVLHRATYEYALPHPIPMPDPPAELVNLPTLARVSCLGPITPNRAQTTDQDFIEVWSLPGEFPRRPDDSATEPPNSKKGRKSGRILRCTEVQALKTVWSKFDGEYYVWARPLNKPISNEDGTFWQWIRSEQGEGWVRFSQLDFR